MQRLTLFILIASLSINLGCADSDHFQNDRFPYLDTQKISQHGSISFVNDFQVGLELATEQKLPIFLYFTADWCTFCQQMERAAFTEDRVVRLTDSFICILVDADREGQLCREFKVDGFPTIVFISQDGRMLHRIEGKQSATKLAAALHKALERQSWLSPYESRLR